MRRAAAFLLVLALAAAAAQAADAPKTNAPAAQTAAVAYDELQHHVGEHVTLRSRFRSTRSGTLLHWSPTEVRLRLDSGAELEMPHDTIRQASLTPAPAPAPTAKAKTEPSK